MASMQVLSPTLEPLVPMVTSNCVTMLNMLADAA